MTENLGFIVHTREELNRAEGKDVMVLGSSHYPGIHPGTVYRGTGEDAPGDAWYDTCNEYNVGSDDIMLPAHVFFTPKQRRIESEQIEPMSLVLTEAQIAVIRAESSKYEYKQTREGGNLVSWRRLLRSKSDAWEKTGWVDENGYEYIA